MKNFHMSVFVIITLFFLLFGINSLFATDFEDNALISDDIQDNTLSNEIKNIEKNDYSQKIQKETQCCQLS